MNYHVVSPNYQNLASKRNGQLTIGSEPNDLPLILPHQVKENKKIIRKANQGSGYLPQNPQEFLNTDKFLFCQSVSTIKYILLELIGFNFQ